MTPYILLTVVPYIFIVKARTWPVYWIAVIAALVCVAISSVFSFSGKCASMGCGDGIANFFNVVGLGIGLLALVSITAAIKANFGDLSGPDNREARAETQQQREP